VSVEDPEGITSDGEHVYVVGSQSRGRSPRSAGLVRFRFDASGRAERVEAVSDLAAMLAGRIPSVDDRHRHEDALNIEGLAWDPGGRRLLLGLRSPLASGMALLVPLKLRDPRGPFQAANLEVEEPIRLDLGGSGIRSIEADPADGTFWIVAGGVTGAGKARLVRWGGKGPGVTDVVAFPPHLRPEGVAILGAKGVKTALVLCDTGEFVVVHAGPGEPRRGAR
jgi:hypothetical protein